ncbi:MAG: stage 0 sporulation family protein [Clostridia bacterium]|nr:stage 0 sporulation family protein [Clostridia bacterium]
MNNQENTTPNANSDKQRKNFPKENFNGRRNKHYHKNRHHNNHQKGKEDINQNEQSLPQNTESLKKEDVSLSNTVPYEVENLTPVSTSDNIAPISLKEPEEDNLPKVEVVGVRFKKAGKVYYFAPGNLKLKLGDAAVVETARGPELGDVACAKKMVREKDIVQPLRAVIRVATKEDIVHGEENKQKEKEAFSVCLKKIEEHGLDMKLVDVEYTFDNSKLLFYFTSAGRVDFRDLVKDLASVFRTRIELRQIGIRDEAKLMGGLGACGRPLCCASFLSDFVQVSIKMVKEQNLSLNSTKISGACGRLMCCMRYEHETYESEIKRTPSVGSVVKTDDGIGNVVEINPLAGLVKVKLEDKNDASPKYYHRDNVKVIKASKSTEQNDAEEEPDSEA